MTVAAILLAYTVNPLICELPNEFFLATNGTQSVLGREVPAECVYDDASSSGKCMRVTADVAAFYYALVSGYLERDLVFTAQGDLRTGDTPPISAATAYNYLQQGDLYLPYLGQNSWLCSASNRVVWALGRFKEGTLTHGLASAWLAYRRGQRAWDGPYAYAAPRIFEDPQGANSIDFPEINFWKPNQIASIVTSNVIAHSWVTWPQLDDYPYSHYQRAASLPVDYLAQMMAANCENDPRDGSPATWRLSYRTMNVGESFTNVIETLAPGCLGNFTNETMRLDYRRIVALGRLLSIEDRLIYPSPFGSLQLEQEINCTNFVEATVGQFVVCAVTNSATASALRYDESLGLVADFAFDAGNLQIISNNTFTTTNFFGSGPLAAANKGITVTSLSDTVGGATFEATISLDSFKSYTDSTVTNYAFGGWWTKYDSDVISIDMWRMSDAPPWEGGMLLHWADVSLSSLTCTNINLNVWWNVSCKQAWSLDVLDIPDNARVPTPRTHNCEQTFTNGSITTYSPYFPKWLFANGSLVRGIDIFSAGNVVSRRGVKMQSPAFVNTNTCDAVYYHKRHWGMDYSSAFDALWYDVESARKAVIQTYTAFAEAAPGTLPSFISPKAWVVSDLEGTWRHGGDDEEPLPVDHPELYYYDGEFHDAARNVVSTIRVTLGVGPDSPSSNEVSQAFSAAANCGYLGGFSLHPKNLRPQTNE